MMTIDNFVFTPADGLRNAVSFKTTPDSEADARDQVQDISDQIRDYINTTIVAAINAKLDLTGGNLAGALASNNTLAGTALIASGLTGATAASRYVGATTSGAPVSGTFAKGDYVIDQAGALWVCNTAGTPGTWTKVGGATNTAIIGNGLYTGDGTANRTINVGFTPKFVLIEQSNGYWAQHFAGAIPNYYNIHAADSAGGTAMSTSRVSGAFNGITTNGFIVGTSGANFNASGTSYPWLAIG